MDSTQVIRLLLVLGLGLVTTEAFSCEKSSCRYIEDWPSIKTYCRGTTGTPKEEMVCCKSSDNPSNCEQRNWGQNEGYCKQSKSGFTHGYCCQTCNKRVNFSQKDNTDVAGKDITQFSGSLYEMCTDLAYVKDRCAGMADCAGFTWNGKCGYFKTAVGDAKSRSGWTLYVKQ